jgi:hypothetical protein
MKRPHDLEGAILAAGRGPRTDTRRLEKERDRPEVAAQSAVLQAEAAAGIRDIDEVAGRFGRELRHPNIGTVRAILDRARIGGAASGQSGNTAGMTCWHPVRG